MPQNLLQSLAATQGENFSSRRVVALAFLGQLFYKSKCYAEVAELADARFRS